MADFDLPASNPERVSPSANNRRHQWALSAALLSCIFLQKIGVPVGGNSLGIVYVILCGTLALITLWGSLGVSISRLVLFVLFVFSAVFSQLLATQRPVPTAILIVFVLYLPFIFTFDIPRKAYLAFLDTFQVAMLAIVGVVVIQQVVQHSIGAVYWPNLDGVVPDSLLIPGYVYMRETAYMSGIYMPNGIFFLEPSILSQFLAISAIIELIFFMRMKRLIVILIGIMLTMAGSGLFILALSLPFFAIRYGRRTIPLLFLAILMIAPVAVFSGWDRMVAQRLGEFGTPGTSAYVRYAAPLGETAQGLREDPLRIVRGKGAGSTVNDARHNNLGLTKLVDEYGLVTTIFFFAFLLVCLFGSAPSAILSWTLLVYYTVGGGGLSVPIYTVPLVLLVSLIRVVEEHPETGPIGRLPISTGQADNRASGKPI